MSFGARIKKLASETAIYGFSSILGRLINFALLPFYTQFFPPDEYGPVVAVYAAFVFLNILYTYGMESAYLKFASGTEGRERIPETFSTATWSLLASSIVLSLLLVAFRAPVGDVISLDASWYFLLNFAAVIVVLDTAAVVPLAELRLSSRPWYFAFARLSGILLNVALNVYLIAFAGMGIEAIFIANIASSALVLLILLPVYVGYLRLKFRSDLWNDLMRFGLPFLPGGLGYALTETVSRFFLGHMSRDRVIALYGDHIDAARLDAEAQTRIDALRQSAEAQGTLADPDVIARLDALPDSVFGDYVLGVFGACYKLAIFMMLVAQMFRYAWQPFFLQHAEDPDAKPLFARVFTLFTAGGLVVFLTISFFVEQIVAIPLPGGRYLIQPQYWLGLHIVPVLLAAYLFQGWYYNFSAGLYIQKKTKYFVHNTLIGAAVTLVLNILFVRHYGMMAAALATLAAYGSMAMALYITQQRFYAVPYEWGRVISIWLLAAAIFFAWRMVPVLQVWWVEILLVLAFITFLFVLKVVSLGALRRDYSPFR